MQPTHRSPAVRSLGFSFLALALLTSGQGVEGQSGPCHDCIPREPTTGCVQCVLYVIVGMNDCSQPHCDLCILDGGYCVADGFAAAPRVEADAVQYAGILEVLRKDHEVTEPSLAADPVAKLRAVRRALAAEGLFLTADETVETCAGVEIASVQELLRGLLEPRRPTVALEAGTVPGV